MKVVIDTNVIISAMFFGGKPKELISLLLDGKIKAFASKEIIYEYQNTTQYLLNKYKSKNFTTSLSFLISLIKIIETKSNIRICRDPYDDKFINCALDSKSFYIISGDKDLLTLKKYKNIEILNAKDFLKKINS